MSSNIKKILIALLIVVLVLILGFAALFGYTIKKPAGTGSAKIVFEIPDNTSTVDIANGLADKDLLNTDWAFILYTKLAKKTLLSGSYVLSGDMTIVEIVDKLSSGDTAIWKITIPEGYRTEQIGQYLAEKKYADYTKFMAAASGLSGKIFPDTYFVKVGTNEENIVKIMNDNYGERTSGITVTNEDLNVASIVEREAKSDADRPIIAGIFKNRLAAGMKLESNPTVQYAYDSIQIKKPGVDPSSYDFWHTTNGVAFSAIDSPFNTYLNVGLPPTPICNPGLKSIEATLNYTKSDYYYFFHDANDKLYLSKTYAEHSSKVNLYLK